MEGWLGTVSDKKSCVDCNERPGVEVMPEETPDKMDWTQGWVVVCMQCREPRRQRILENHPFHGNYRPF